MECWFWAFFPHPLTTPLLLATCLVILFLSWTAGISYKDYYYIGGSYLNNLIVPSLWLLWGFRFGNFHLMKHHRGEIPSPLGIFLYQIFVWQIQVLLYLVAKFLNGHFLPNCISLFSYQVPVTTAMAVIGYAGGIATTYCGSCCCSYWGAVVAVIRSYYFKTS